MSESSHEKPDTGLIPDDDLPDDLNPDENPLARDPDDERNTSEGSDDKKVEGLPDAGDA